MKPSFWVIALTVIFLAGCEKESANDDLINDSNYPTTIYRLSDEELTKEKNAYYERNKYIESGLSSFGFCSLDGDARSVASPQKSNEISEKEAFAIIKKFVSNNKENTGVNKSDEVIFTIINKSVTYNSDVLWTVLGQGQKINNIEVLYTGFNIRLINGEVCHCSGNWFPKIYIPKTFNYDSLKAKTSLIGKEVTHYWWSGEHTVKITSEAVDLGSSRLVIYPNTSDDAIRLHVVWEINIPVPVFHKIYVDVMTGEIISQIPTIIS